MRMIPNSQEHAWGTWAAPKKADGTFDHDTALIGDDMIACVDEKLFPYLKSFRQSATGHTQFLGLNDWLERRRLS